MNRKNAVAKFKGVILNFIMINQVINVISMSEEGRGLGRGEILYIMQSL